jgi:hypothetical protein
MITCKQPQCDHKQFRTISALRKHQWKEHRDLYANVNMVKAREVKAREVIRHPGQHLEKPKMTVEELLVGLKRQQSFVNDVVALIEESMKRYESTTVRNA